MRDLIRILAVVILSLLLLGEETLAAKSRKPKVRSVTFEGNTSYPSSRLGGLMLTRSSRFLAPSRFHSEIFQGDMETLIAFYKQNGFLQARILDTLISLDSVTSKVDISIRLDEGARTFVEGVTVFGNQFFADSVLMRHIGIRKQDPLRRPVIEDAVVTLLHLYAEHGYLDASVTPRVQVNDSLNLALVDFGIQEGVRSCVGSITIDGAKRTRRYVIDRELNFRQNDTIRYSSLISSQRRLYLTGLFESVFVRPVQSSPGDSAARDVRIEVKEKPSSELSFSIGYGTVEKVRGRIELNTSSLAGTARKSGIGLEANFIRQGVALSFSEPWTLGTRWKTDLMIFGRLQQEPAYHAEVIGGSMTIGRKLGPRTSLSLSYRLENTNFSRVDLAAYIEETDPRIRSLTLSLNHDARDNLFDPARGWYVSWTNEIAGSFLQGSSTFARSIVTLKQFRPLGRNAVLGSSLELGWMSSFGDEDEIPLSERFYAGGPTSLRGFGYQMVGPVDINGEPFGGQVKLVWNVLELRQSIFRMFGGALFIDVGNVWMHRENVKLTDLRLNSGAGLRINSPLGIIRLDCGINLDRRADEPRTKVFISMGQAF